MASEPRESGKVSIFTLTTWSKTYCNVCANWSRRSVSGREAGGGGAIVDRRQQDLRTDNRPRDLTQAIGKGQASMPALTMIPLKQLREQGTSGKGLGGESVGSWRWLALGLCG